MKGVDMRDPLAHKTAAVLMLATVGVALGTLGTTAKPRSEAVAVNVVSRPECPMDSLDIVPKDSSPAGTPGQLPLSGPITNIPEFHDCQRFIRGKAYDSLYAIFAAFRLPWLNLFLDSMQLRDSIKRLPPGTPTRFVAVGAATVYSYGGTYKPLGIQPGFNCLYLYSPPQWRAKLVPSGPLNDKCDPVADIRNANGLDLDVHPSAIAGGLTAADYAPVARWDFAQGTQYISIKCGAAWCEIGPRGFTGSQRYAGASPKWDYTITGVPTPAELHRILSVKGWHDAQFLSTGTRPGPAWGTLIPHPRLGIFDAVAQFDNRWVQVAAAVVDRGSYKFGLSRRPTMIYLCRTNAAANGCPGVPPAAKPCPAEAGFLWWGKLESGAGRPPQYRCVTRRDHSGALIPPIPGVTRWRWKPHDEVIWMRCAFGCCELS